MKRKSTDPRFAPGNSAEIAKDLRRFNDLGMKREVLRMAKRAFGMERITAELFATTMNALLTQENHLKPWTPLVEAAHTRLSKHGQQSVRFWILSFHYCARDYEAANRFIPRRFDGAYRFTELVFTIDTLLSLGRMEQAGIIAKRLPRAIEETEQPMTKANLLLTLAEYLARIGKWDEAISISEAAQCEPVISQTAVVNIVEIYAACALRAIQQGFQLIEQFKQQVDPKSETILPGNDAAIQATAEKRFRKLQKMLERVVSKERQAELGIS